MNIQFVYFIYGLAFFSMGLVLLFESARTPSLAKAPVLVPLVIFGFVHGTHEWIEMALLNLAGQAVFSPLVDGWLRIGILAVSFISLLLFGILMLWPDRVLSPGETRRIAAAVLVYLGMVALVSLAASWGAADPQTRVDVVVRSLLAAPGALLAGVALLRWAGNPAIQGAQRAYQYVRWAAVGFIIYALTQWVVPPADIFPATILNTSIFRAVVGFPIQLVRAGAATLITVCLVLMVNTLEHIRQTQFIAAEQARLVALDQLQDELVERERMRQELLRHIVLAQEDERTRVARELHDETSQILTAFTFHLAVLRQSLPKAGKVLEQLEYLQNLSRQMAEGIYRLVRDLRPAQLDDLGLVAALNYLVDEQEKRTGLAVDLKISGQKRRLDPLVETVLFRVAQEALTNVARHSGAEKADLGLGFAPDEVILRIEDHGCGFELRPALAKGFGLAGMQERAESIGAALAIETVSGQGTIVTVRARSLPPAAGPAIETLVGISIPKLDQ